MTLFEMAEKLSAQRGLEIPALQRGLVWNAARMEALWDSIMRGIPIGAISVRNGQLFDGQQRAHAVCVGINGRGRKDEGEILWLDLRRGEKKYVKKFHFCVTTLAHPWGYAKSDDEKRNHLLDHWEQRLAVERLESAGLEWERRGIPAARPRPDEFWPWKANLPVPFGVVVDFVGQAGSCLDFESFCSWIHACYPKSNWAIHFGKTVKSVPQEEEYWQEIKSAISRLPEYRVPVICADSMSPDDEALYFKRMNKNGEEPPDHEIRYSMLKWLLPELKGIDELAGGFSAPSMLAQLAMVYFKNSGRLRSRRSEYTTNIIDADVASLAGNAEFIRFVRIELPQLIKGADELLNVGCRPNGLHPWNRTRICQNCWPLYMYVMKASQHPEADVNYAGLAMLVRLYASDALAMVKELWCADSVRDGIRMSILNGSLAIPVYPEEISCLKSETVISGDRWQDKLLAWTKNGPGARWAAISGGFSHDSATVEMLVYSCRDFMYGVFGDYNASDPCWQEQNRPWDYDHILPKIWIRDRNWGREGKNDFTDVCRFTRGLYGNSAPIPYSWNRSKNARPPGENYPFGPGGNLLDRGNGLLADIDAIARYEDRRPFDANWNEDQIKNFVFTTVKRSYDLYSEMFENLGWRSILDLRQKDLPRYVMLERVAKKLGGTLYVKAEGRRIPLSDEADWAYLIRFLPKVQLCVPVGRAVVCYETDDPAGLDGWIGICCRNDENEIKDEDRPAIEATLGDEYVSDAEWYGYREIKKITEDQLLTMMQQHIKLLKNVK